MTGRSGHLARTAAMADKPIKRGQRIVRKDQVNTTPFERRDKIMAPFHAGGRTRDARGFQGGLNQRRIVGIILQVQNAERGFHLFNLFIPAGENDFTGLEINHGIHPVSLAQWLTMFDQPRPKRYPTSTSCCRRPIAVPRFKCRQR